MLTREEFRTALEQKIRETPHATQAVDLMMLLKTLREPAWLPQNPETRKFLIHLRTTLVVEAILQCAPDRLAALERVLPITLNDLEREQAAAMLVLLRPQIELPSPTHDAPIEVQ